MRCIEIAARSKKPLVFATPNANFLALAEQSAAFRENILRTGLSLADGMPIVWIGRLLGIPINERVSGSSLIERYLAGGSPELRVFFFGGEDGAAEAASARVAAQGGPLKSVGWHNPGFGSIEAMSSAEIIARINASGADVLVVSLGAEKGHAWIERNRNALNVPVISHLGATVNFLAGTVQRAPRGVQRIGLEWLWRIWQEPRLAKRYAGDAAHLLREVFTAVLPLAARGVFRALRRHKPELTVELLSEALIVRGELTEATLPALQQAIADSKTRVGKDLVVDVGAVTHVDARALGYLYELVYRRSNDDVAIKCVSRSPVMNRLLTLHRTRGLVERRLATSERTFDGPDRRAESAPAK
jgi:N-acetylglucosaminyldiphosphoundecaprenol N-acetyl-beta-D-mannosaminyltransferase